MSTTDLHMSLSLQERNSNCQLRLQIRLAIIWFISPRADKFMSVTSLNIIKFYVVHFIVIVSPVLLFWNSLTVLAFAYFFHWENENWDLAHLNLESNKKTNKGKRTKIWAKCVSWQTKFGPIWTGKWDFSLSPPPSPTRAPLPPPPPLLNYVRNDRNWWFAPTLQKCVCKEERK